MTRRTAREAAMMLLYAWATGGEALPMTEESLTLDEMILPELGEADGKQERGFLIDVVNGVAAHRARIDEEIERCAVGWTTARMAKVDLSILRLGVYELLMRDDIPGAVSVNEAIELTHRFSTPNAGSFVNGILGSISRALDKP